MRRRFINKIEGTLRNQLTVVLTLLIRSIPLSNTWTACIGKDDGTYVLECLCQAVSLDRRSDLFRAWSTEEGDL
jgi:hypothetical protein